MSFSSVLRSALTMAAAFTLAATVSVRQPNLQGQILVAESLELDLVSTDNESNPKAHTIDWRTLGGMDLRTGRPTDILRQLDGKRIRIPGYIVPLDDFAESVTEFLLVPYFGACIHTPPPPPNQMLHVRVGNGAHGSSSWAAPVWVEGRFSLKAVNSPYGVVAFQLKAESISPYS